MQRPYYLGCPMWQNPGWAGSFLVKGTRPAEMLAGYAQVFNSVEGNTSFYALPTPDQALRWRDQTPSSFRFTFKFPKAISHERQLVDCQAEVERFYAFLAPLSDRVGCVFLQMPPQFHDYPRLARFLTELPRVFPVAVEVRHPSFFDEGPGESALVGLLSQLGMDQVIFETSRLMALTNPPQAILEAQRKKPKMPLRVRALGAHPFLRYVGRPKIEEDDEPLIFWARHVACWIREGKQPFVFFHQVPEDVLAPQLCRRFHECLRQHLPDLPELPPFPAEVGPRQLSLFD